MLASIKNALLEAGVKEWSIEDVHTDNTELYFIRRNLDTRRRKAIRKYQVRVYRDFEKDGKRYRGTSAVSVVPTESQEDVTARIRDAWFAASFVENPWYALPEKQVGESIPDGTTLAPLSSSEAALRMAEAIFAGDDDPRAYVNSAEIFASKTTVHLLTSAGTDVSYARSVVSGEFVAQCKEPVDVELYRDFAYDALEPQALTEKVRTALREAADRTAAQPILPTGSYDVLLTGDHVAAVLRYYMSRSSASMVYAGYSSWKLGDQVQAEEIRGEALDLTLKADAPYSREGIPMVDRPLLRAGKLETYHSGAQYAHYLGVPATGEYRALRCGNGSTSLEEMKQRPYLLPVTFSDFQLDPYTGHFGGEIRLAYWFDGEKTRIVTGGSINGSLLACASDLTFSREQYHSLRYDGPQALLLRNVNAASGAAEAQN